MVEPIEALALRMTQDESGSRLELNLVLAKV